MKRKIDDCHAMGLEGLTLTLAFHTPKMFKIFRSGKVLSINEIKHDFTPRKKGMLCKCCANSVLKKFKCLIIKHLNFRKVGATGIWRLTPPFSLQIE